MSSEFGEVSSYIARWALPNEGIPMYIFWKGDPKFDIIKIEKPEDVIIREYYNVDKKFKNSIELHYDELKTKNYFGLVVTSPPFESLSREVKIILTFIKGSEIIFKMDFITRIVRPRIDLEVPETIKIPDEGETGNINIKLTYTGYGNVHGKIIVSEDPDELILNVKDLRDFMLIVNSSVLFKRFLEVVGFSEEDYLGTKIPDDQYDYRRLLSRIVDTSDFTPESFMQDIMDFSKVEKMAEIISKSFEDREDIARNFFKSVLDFVEKRPVEGVFLLDPSLKSLDLDTGNRKIFVCTAYLDDFGNYYTDVAEIPIHLDSRKKILFKQKWQEDVGDWKWLQKKN